MKAQVWQCPIALHVVWHPRSKEAERIADGIFAIFRNNVTQIEGGFGIPVVFYSKPANRLTDAPPAIDLDRANRHVVLLLIEEDLIDAVTQAADWRSWFDAVQKIGAQQPNQVLVIPISLSDEALDFCNREGLRNAIRWHDWRNQGNREKIDRLAVHLIPTLFNSLREEAGTQADIHAHTKVHLFLSHANADGSDLVDAFRKEIRKIPGLGDFFSEVDIQPGDDFEAVLRTWVGKSALLAIHTDAYASRDWCCWEVVAGKRFNVPIVAAHCVRDREHRAFPYLGNVPSLRVDEATPARVLEVIRRLLEEVLRELLWRCLVSQWRALRPEILADAIDTWRSPEVVWLMLGQEIAQKQSDNILVLHPDPPLGRNERSIIETFKPKIALLTPIQLMAQ